MYASIRNISSKSDSDLRMLKDLGIDDLYVGVESGSAEVIEQISKGHTIDQAHEQLRRLDTAGYRWIANLMLGIGGSGRGLANARRTAEFLNQHRPKAIWVGTLGVFDGGDLHRAAHDGLFVEASEGEKLEEERELLEQLNLENVRLYGVHPGNAVRVFGELPGDRQLMIDTIDEALTTLSPEFLATSATRISL